MQKPIVHAPVPEFDQTTQMVRELPPVEHEDHIFVGVEIVDLPPEEGGIDGDV